MGGRIAFKARQGFLPATGEPFDLAQGEEPLILERSDK
jgi:hypothetical protein